MLDRVAAGSITYSTVGTHLFNIPLGWGKVTICMVGGGGSAGHFGGGYAGQVVSQDVAVSYGGGTVTVVVGTGGVFPNDWTGQAGAASKFGTVSANGGDAGWGNFTGSGYQGVGATKMTCGGTNYDGTNSGSYGGQSSGFGKGGKGLNSDTIAGEHGGVGSGGGANLNSYQLSGNGGRGEVRISWGD